MTTPAQSDPALLEDSADGVVVLTINRPAARNALSPEVVAALDDALTRFVEDDSARVAIMTGSPPAFCAGLDLKVYADAGADRRSVAAVIRRVGDLSKPIIGAVPGPAVAGGLEMALGCDWLIGSPSAAFADSHVTIGAFPGGGMTARLARRIGVANAKAVSLGGMRIDAEAALRWGLLSEVVDEQRLLPRARELAGAIAEADQDLVQSVRHLYEGNDDRSLAEALAAERAALELWRQRKTSSWNTQSTKGRHE